MRELIEKQVQAKGAIFGYPALQFFTWMAMGSFCPCYVALLTDRGLGYTQTGIILMVNAVVSIVVQPFWGFVSDRIKSIRKVYVLCMAAASLFSFALTLAKSMTALIVLFSVFMLFVSLITPLLDNWTYQRAKGREKRSYGAMRVWGSISTPWLPTA